MTTLPGTVGAGTAIEAKTMDAMGNIATCVQRSGNKARPNERIFWNRRAEVGQN